MSAKVKPIEWRKNADGTFWDAKTIVGWYYVEHIGKKWRAEKGTDTLAETETSDEAKTAAQTDYESRVLSALEQST